MIQLAISYPVIQFTEKGHFMSDKEMTDLKTFIENVNKGEKKRNGKKVRFGFTKRKRKN